MLEFLTVSQEFPSFGIPYAIGCFSMISRIDTISRSGIP